MEYSTTFLWYRGGGLVGILYVESLFKLEGSFIVQDLYFQMKVTAGKVLNDLTLCSCDLSACARFKWLGDDGIDVVAKHHPDIFHTSTWGDWKLSRLICEHVFVEFNYFDSHEMIRSTSIVVSVLIEDSNVLSRRVIAR